MRNIRFSLLSTLMFLACAFCAAQQPAPLPGQVLVSLQPGQSPQALARRMGESLFLTKTTAKKISNLLNVWLLETDVAQEQTALEWLLRQPEVRAAQFNYQVETRGGPLNNILPNDPLIAQQWQYVNTGANGGTPDADLDADLAWNIATGGLTPAGDTIVVAVIDGGIDLNHSDLIANLWKNRAEIPNDNLDNDNNGYVDDFRGWNTYADNDNILGVATGHGTPVSAIVGAKGNNNNGVSGVNWNVKIMFVAGGGTVADILASYDYVLQARQRYNASNGASGAFVVAVNTSFGINYGQPSAYPLWCAAIDSLGAAGVLNVAATANIPVNVDEIGDMPTACPSDFLIAVTNLTNTDAKASSAAWGAVHIDLGAYGQAVFSASANNGYGYHSGTSFASPQVAGAVGLLYSSPCPNLISLAKTDPAAAALWAKNIILDSAVPNASLQGITVTDGRLNLHTMLQEYEDQCSACPPPFALQALDISKNSALLKWSEIADFQTVALRWRETGAANWNVVNGVENTYFLENLNACTEHEFSLSAVCEQGQTSAWSPVFVFKTDGCCEPPAVVEVEWVTATSAAIAWSEVAAANGYRLRVRPSVGGSWENYVVNAAAATLQNLLPCTDYEAQVQTICDTGATAFSNPVFFKTAGCGSCTDSDYCSAEATYADEEWIASVIVGDWSHDSGESGDGYQNFTDGLSSVLQLQAKDTVQVTLTPGFEALPYKEFFRIFVDFNLDGDFDDAGELAFDPGWAVDAPISGLIFVPDFPAVGLTRMRVLMKYKGANNPPPDACESFEFGQVEDYCVQLSPPVSTGDPTNAAAQMRIFPQPASDEVWLDLPGDTQGEWDVSVWGATGRLMFSETAMPDKGLASLDVALWPSGVYVVKATQGGRRLEGRLVKI